MIVNMFYFEHKRPSVFDTIPCSGPEICYAVVSRKSSEMVVPEHVLQISVLARCRMQPMVDSLSLFSTAILLSKIHVCFHFLHRESFYCLMELF